MWHGGQVLAHFGWAVLLVLSSWGWWNSQRPWSHRTSNHSHVMQLYNEDEQDFMRRVFVKSGLGMKHT